MFYICQNSFKVLFSRKKIDFEEEEDVEVIKPSLIIDDHVYYSATTISLWGKM